MHEFDDLSLYAKNNPDLFQNRRLIRYFMKPLNSETKKLINYIKLNVEFKVLDCIIFNGLFFMKRYIFFFHSITSMICLV